MVSFEDYKNKYNQMLDVLSKHMKIVFEKPVSDKYDYYDTLEKFSNIMKISRELQAEIRAEFTNRNLI